MTDRMYSDVQDGIWDDGEFISWDWINSQLYQQELKAEFPKADPAIVELFQDLISISQTYKQRTGRYLDIFGELGEFFAEIRYGLKRHRLHAAGSDGRIGNDHVEVKTISPLNRKQKIQIKRSGNFNKVLIVLIDENFEIQSRMFKREKLSKGDGKYARITWESVVSFDLEQIDQESLRNQT
jgi:hypothetical protein